MAYSRDVTGLEIEPPAFTFAGDETVPPDAYAAVLSNTYLRKLPFAMMLMQRFGVPSDPENHERIKRGLVCMGWLDHMLDEAPDREASLQAYADLVDTLTQPKEALNLPSWIRPEVQDSIVLLRNAISELPQENKSAIVRKAQRIGATSLEKASADSAADYSVILSEEGALSSDVVIECLDTHTQKTNAYSRLHTFNARAMTAATLLDAAIDLRQDYQNGLTKVAPSLRNRLFLYQKAFGHLPYIVKHLGARGVLTMLKVGIN